jgi:hypothetical protein
VEEILEFADHEMYKHKFQSKNSRLVTPSIWFSLEPFFGS